MAYARGDRAEAQTRTTWLHSYLLYSKPVVASMILRTSLLSEQETLPTSCLIVEAEFVVCSAKEYRGIRPDLNQPGEYLCSVRRPSEKTHRDPFLFGITFLCSLMTLLCSGGHKLHARRVSPDFWRRDGVLVRMKWYRTVCLPRCLLGEVEM